MASRKQQIQVTLTLLLSLYPALPLRKYSLSLPLLLYTNTYVYTTCLIVCYYVEGRHLYCSSTHLIAQKLHHHQQLLPMSSRNHPWCSSATETEYKPNLPFFPRYHPPHSLPLFLFTIITLSIFLFTTSCITFTLITN